jgi:hypothetical protein
VNAFTSPAGSTMLCPMVAAILGIVSALVEMRAEVRRIRVATR